MILEEFRNTPFRMQDLSAAYPSCANLATKAKRLERDGEIIRLKKGLYVASPKISRMDLSPFLLANHIFGPSYVSMQTALRYEGLIPEAVYTVQSMTVGIAKTFENKVGSFNYIHVPTPYYQIGVTIKTEHEASFMIASPEKALCDLMVYTPHLNLRFQTEIRDYLESDIRFDMDELVNLNLDIIKECAKVSRKKNMLNQLLKFIENERNI
jgi:predicted transcriptional regulator of viral defense system